MVWFSIPSGNGFDLPSTFRLEKAPMMMIMMRKMMESNIECFIHESECLCEVDVYM